jgi:hypothetical protein
MRYWTRLHNIRYELSKRGDKALLWVAHRLPKRLRMWVVVDASAAATCGPFQDRTPSQVSCLDVIGTFSGAN